MYSFANPNVSTSSQILEIKASTNPFQKSILIAPFFVSGTLVKATLGAVMQHLTHNGKNIPIHHLWLPRLTQPTVRLVVGRDDFGYNSGCVRRGP